MCPLVTPAHVARQRGKAKYLLKRIKNKKIPKYASKYGQELDINFSSP
jgi:hypothetical protein